MIINSNINKDKFHDIIAFEPIEKQIYNFLKEKNIDCKYNIKHNNSFSKYLQFMFDK